MNTLDLSYLEDELTRAEALKVLEDSRSGIQKRSVTLETGYPGYDTAIGWFNYSDEKVKENIYKAIAEGFTAMKLKVGSSDADRDVRRTIMVRETAGDAVKIMLDANQQWTLPQAVKVCTRLQQINPYWIEEPPIPIMCWHINHRQQQ